jgi:hypothetical protein
MLVMIRADVGVHASSYLVRTDDYLEMISILSSTARRDFFS